MILTYTNVSCVTDLEKHRGKMMLKHYKIFYQLIKNICILAALVCGSVCVSCLRSWPHASANTIKCAAKSQNRVCICV